MNMQFSLPSLKRSGMHPNSGNYRRKYFIKPVYGHIKASFEKYKRINNTTEQISIFAITKSHFSSSTLVPLLLAPNQVICGNRIS